MQMSANHSRQAYALGSGRMLAAVSCHKRSRGAVGTTVPTSDAVYERASDGVSEDSGVGNGPGDGLSEGTHMPWEVGAEVRLWPWTRACVGSSHGDMLEAGCGVRDGVRVV